MAYAVNGGSPVKNILKRICLFLYIFLLVFVLNGCANGRNPQNEFTGEDGTLAAESVDFYEVLQQMELSADNTEDTIDNAGGTGNCLSFYEVSSVL